MKGISTVIATILMLIIAIALAGTAYMYIAGVFTATAQGVEVVNAYCDRGIVTITIRNIGTNTITSFDVRQTSPSDDVLTASFQGTIEPGRTITYKDICEGEKSRSCIYRITPPVGKTVPATATCTEKPESLVLSLHFDEGSGTTAKDSSLNGNDGILKPDPYSLVFVADNGAGPWGARPNIPSTADWIWKNSDAESSAPIEDFWVIRKFDLSNPTTIRLNITVDNYVDIYVDNTFVGSDGDWTVTTSWTVSLSAGTHYLRLRVGNSGGPAGLIASVEAPIGNILFLTQEDGTWVIGPIWVDGKFGKALQFDGVNDYVGVSVDAPEYNFTIEMWIKTTCLNCGVFEIDCNDRGACGHDRHFYISNGVACHRVWMGGGWCTNKQVNDGSFHHWVLTTQTGVGQKVYIDSQLVGTFAYDHSDFNWQTGLTIGFSQDAIDDYFNGIIDEVRIYNQVII